MGGTTGTPNDITRLRAKHGRAIEIFLVIYTVQIITGLSRSKEYDIDIWIDNTEVLSRKNDPVIGSSLKSHLVLYYDMWRVMDIIQAKISIKLR